MNSLQWIFWICAAIVALPLVVGVFRDQAAHGLLYTVLSFFAGGLTVGISPILAIIVILLVSVFGLIKIADEAKNDERSEWNRRESARIDMEQEAREEAENLKKRQMTDKAKE